MCEENNDFNLDENATLDPDTNLDMIDEINKTGELYYKFDEDDPIYVMDILNNNPVVFEVKENNSGLTFQDGNKQFKIFIKGV
jgi:hypothetical protein